MTKIHEPHRTTKLHEPSTLPLQGVHAAITGGGRGIGRAIAERLAGMGASLTLLGRDGDKLAKTAAALGEATCAWRVCDVGDPTAVGAAFEAIATAGKGLAILVNNAGVVQSAKIEETSTALWYDMLRVNLTGAYHCIRAALPLLRAAPQARIVNIASTAGLTGYPYVSAYCAAKHGLIGLTRALAVELASGSITVNAVCPGYADTDLMAESISTIVRKTGRRPDEVRASFASRSPQQRVLAPEEVASTVAWLCLPESQSITGQAIAVCGGEVMTG
ncbi:MAG: SDR family oxidoreductase [Pseudomonadota bacterium]|nr:SDR family oxidoreductase [Pseudomonadota bacterium]